jgi:hypothetical protein
MSTLTVLARKFRRAVIGAQEPVMPAAPRLFNWETFPPPAGSSDAVGDATSVAPSASSPSQTPRPEQALSAIASAIPADVTDFAVVYRGAGIGEPSHGYGVDRVERMLNHDGLAGLDRSVKAEAVLAALEAAGVAIQDVIHDAVLRFKTVLAFEAIKDLETSATAPHAGRIARLESEIEAFRAEKGEAIRALMRETNSAVQALARLRTRARAEQDRYRQAVSPFVESLPAPVIPIESARAEAPTASAMLVAVESIGRMPAGVSSGAPPAAAGPKAG